MVSSLEANGKVRELFGEFIDKVIISLGEIGINAGYTAISTPKDDIGIPTITSCLGIKKVINTFRLL